MKYVNKLSEAQQQEVLRQLSDQGLYGSFLSSALESKLDDLKDLLDIEKVMKAGEV